MSSFKNKSIFKSNGVVFKGVKPLKTTKNDNEDIKEVNDVEIIDESELLKVQEEINAQLERTKITCDEMIKKAQEERENIILTAPGECEEIKKNAYEEGHQLGMKNGYEDGYKEAYEDNIEKAKKESEELIEKANEILLKANNQFTDYLKDRKKDIISLSISIAEKVLREKFNDVDSMNNIIEATIKEYEIKENFVVRTNAIYVESVNDKLNELKTQQLIKGDVFVLQDESVEPGNAIIETNKARLIVGIDCILEKVKEELL